MFWSDGSNFSYFRTSSKLRAYQAFTNLTDGVRDKLSGSNAISFMMFAKRTGNSFRKNIYDFFSHAFKPEIELKLKWIFVIVGVNCVLASLLLSDWSREMNAYAIVNAYVNTIQIGQFQYHKTQTKQKLKVICNSIHTARRRKTKQSMLLFDLKQCDHSCMKITTIFAL